MDSGVGKVEVGFPRLLGGGPASLMWILGLLKGGGLLERRCAGPGAGNISLVCSRDRCAWFSVSRATMIGVNGRNSVSSLSRSGIGTPFLIGTGKKISSNIE